MWGRLGFHWSAAVFRGNEGKGNVVPVFKRYFQCRPPLLKASVGHIVAGTFGRVRLLPPPQHQLSSHWQLRARSRSRVAVWSKARSRVENLRTRLADARTRCMHERQPRGSAKRTTNRIRRAVGLFFGPHFSPDAKNRQIQCSPPQFLSPRLAPRFESAKRPC